MFSVIFASKWTRTVLRMNRHTGIHKVSQSVNQSMDDSWLIKLRAIYSPATQNRYTPSLPVMAFKFLRMTEISRDGNINATQQIILRRRVSSRPPV